MSTRQIKDWTLYAQHILDTIAKIEPIEARGDIAQDEVLSDAALRNLQTLSEATPRVTMATQPGGHRRFSPHRTHESDRQRVRQAAATAFSRQLRCLDLHRQF
jgi:hypothetical protein